MDIHRNIVGYCVGWDSKNKSDIGIRNELALGAWVEKQSLLIALQFIKYVLYEFQPESSHSMEAIMKSRSVHSAEQIKIEPPRSRSISLVDEVEHGAKT